MNYLKIGNLSSEERRILAALCDSYLRPEAEEEETLPSRIRLEEKIDEYRGDMQPASLWMFRIMLHMLNLAPLYMFKRLSRFVNLDDKDRDQCLTTIQNSKFYPLRIFFLFFKAIITIVYWEEPLVMDRTGIEIACLLNEGKGGGK